MAVRVGDTLAQIEKHFILATLEHCEGDKRRCAALLGISLRTLYNRLHDWKMVESWQHREPPASDFAA